VVWWRVEGAGKAYGGTLKIAAGQDVQLQATPEAPTGQRAVQTAQIRYVTQTIDVVVGYRQVAGGVVYTPIVTWVNTKVEMQTGVQLVRQRQLQPHHGCHAHPRWLL
jgi:hypothetical protein